MIFIAMILFFFILKFLKKDIVTFLNPLVFPNTANMALPIALYAFGPEAFEYAIIFTTLVFFYHCSIGIFILNGPKKIIEVFKTPLIYTVVLALILNNTETKVNVGLNNAINLLGTTSIPLMMFSLGHKLSETKIVTLNDNLILGSKYSDNLNGTDGEDIFDGWSGNDVINGDAGRDLLIIHASSDDFTISQINNSKFSISGSVYAGDYAYDEIIIDQVEEVLFTDQRIELIEPEVLISTSSITLDESKKIK
jgi:hypothetical protein